MRNHLSFLKVYKKKNTKSEVVTQLLYGETFKKLNQSGSWIKIKNNLDNYKGYIKNKKFPSNQKNTHKVYVLFSNIYLRPKKSSKTKKGWSKIMADLAPTERQVVRAVMGGQKLQFALRKFLPEIKSKTPAYDRIWCKCDTSRRAKKEKKKR